MRMYFVTADLEGCANVLDKQTLIEQASFASVAIWALEQGPGPLRNDPFVRAWRGHLDALTLYYNYCLATSVFIHGVRTTMSFETIEAPTTEVDAEGVTRFKLRVPPWLQDKSLHRSHRAELLRLRPDDYANRGWEPWDAPFLYPRLCIKRHRPTNCETCGGLGYLLKTFNPEEGWRTWKSYLIGGTAQSSISGI